MHDIFVDRLAKQTNKHNWCISRMIAASMQCDEMEPVRPAWEVDQSTSGPCLPAVHVDYRRYNMRTWPEAERGWFDK